MIEILPDVLDYGLVVVFCGTAASKASSKAGAYYANGTNAFWRTLHETGMTPRRFAPSEFRDLLKLRIGLTDVAKFVAGNDSDLSLGDFHPNSLSEKIRLYSPQILAFTSKAAMARLGTLVGCHRNILWLAGKVYEYDTLLRAAIALWRRPRLLECQSLARTGRCLPLPSRFALGGRHARFPK